MRGFIALLSPIFPRAQAAVLLVYASSSERASIRGLTAGFPIPTRISPAYCLTFLF
jgi:hypothetical protein